MPFVAKSRFVDPLPIACATLVLIGAGAVMDMQRLAFLSSLPEASAAMMALPWPRLHILVRLGTVVLFAMWIDRVWANLPALGTVPEQSRVVAVLSFFVPPLCFFRPVQIVNEVWTTASRAPAMRDRRYFSLVVGWWITLLVPILLILTGIGSAWDERWLRMMAGEAFNVIAAFLAVPVIYLASQRQRAATRIALRSPEMAATPAPVDVLERYVSARTATPRPVTIAPSAAGAASAAAVRTSPPPRPRPPAPPIQRVIQQQRGARPLAPRVWQLVLVGAGVVAAVALLVSGAILIRVPRDLAPALIQLGFASMIGAAAFSVAREKPLPGDARRWAARSAAGVVVTLIVLFSVAEGLLQ